MNIKLGIKTCPTCGSGEIKRVKRVWRGEFQSKKYFVPSLSFYECLNCGEKVYDREAMHRIEERSPAFRKVYRRNAA